MSGLSDLISFIIIVIFNDVVGQIMKEVNGLYECEECHLFYEDAEWAKKCEQWCIEHKSCNLEITKHATKQSKLSLS
jgi:hypothetical protein